MEKDKAFEIYQYLMESSESQNGTEEVKAEEKQEVKQEETSVKEDFSVVVEKFDKYSSMEVALRSNLLGKYVNGEYVIEDKVKAELLKLNKVVDFKSDKGLVCHSNYKDFTFKFVIKVEEMPTFSTAKIYLVEELDYVDEKKEIKTLLESTVGPSDKKFIESVLKGWFVNAEGDDSGNTGKELSTLDAILLKVKTDYAFNKDLLELLSQIYVLRMTALLNKLGEKGQEVLDEFNRVMRDYGVKKPSVLKNYAKLKIILDKIIKDKNISADLKTLAEKEVAEIYRKYYKPMERIFTMEDKEVTIAPPKAKKLENLDDVKKSLDKKEGKSAGGGGGKSKGGGGGKSKSYPGAKPLKAGKVQSGGVVIAKIPTPPKVETKPPEKKVEKEKASKENPKDSMTIDVGGVFSELKAGKDNDFGILGKAKKNDEGRRKTKDEPERIL
mgnify:CR=1 FL=1